MMARILAKTDPILFFQTYKPPITIDEIQKAPELFEQIKSMCEEVVPIDAKNCFIPCNLIRFYFGYKSVYKAAGHLFGKMPGSAL